MRVLVLSIAICSVFCGAEQRISMAELGLAPDSRINAVPYVNRAMEMARGKGPVALVFEKGRYDFWPWHCMEKDYYESNTTIVNPRRCPIFIEKQQDLTVEGNGAAFIFHGRMQPFTIDGCERITIRNLSVDWDVPFGAEAEIVAVSPAAIDLRLDPRLYPYEVSAGRLFFLGEGWKSEWGGVKWNDPMEFDRQTPGVVPGTGDDICLGDGWEGYTATALGDGKVRISYPFKRLPAEGNYLVLRHGVRDHAGVFITESRGILIENFNMHSNTGLSFLAQYAEDITYRNVNCVPDPAKRKILSVHDDGFHFSNCKGLLTMEGCRFAGLMDDSVNVHGTAIRVSERLSGRQLLGRFMHHQSKGFVWARPGDQIGLQESKTMQTVAVAAVESFDLLTPDLCLITFDQPLPDRVVAGYALENLTWTPAVTIRNCDFGSHRARGILVSTPRPVLIEQNRFESSGCAILIPGDANYWFESGAVRDVIIRDNIFSEGCLTSSYQFCEGIISIVPEIPGLDASLPPYHRNIRITGNSFAPFDYPVLYAKSVDGITFSGNRIMRSRRYQPRHPRKSTLTFDACRRIDVRDNRIGEDVPGRNITLLRTPIGELALDDARNLKVELPAGK